MTYGNGATTAYTYNDARGFLSRVLTSNGATTLQDLNYARDVRGQISAVTSPQAGKSWNYGYDALDRLTSASNVNTPAETVSYAYDDADNMLYNSSLCAANPNMVYPTQGATSIRPHAPTSICGTSVTYDANGNTLSYDVDGSGPIPPRTLVSCQVIVPRIV